MTSRQTVGAINRTGKCYNLAPSKAVTGLMVKVDWTTAERVSITTNKAFKYTVYSVAKVHGHYEVQSSAPMTFKAGMHLLLVKSGLEGYYYIVNLATGCCTCAEGRLHHECKHVQGLDTRHEWHSAPLTIVAVPATGTHLAAA